MLVEWGASTINLILALSISNSIVDNVIRDNVIANNVITDTGIIHIDDVIVKCNIFNLDTMGWIFVDWIITDHGLGQKGVPTHRRMVISDDLYPFATARMTVPARAWE
jgi:hypothetical protein